MQPRSVYWGWVRIAFVISAGIVWYNAFSSLKAMEVELSSVTLRLLRLQKSYDSLGEENRLLKSRAPAVDPSEIPVMLILDSRLTSRDR